MESSDKYAQAFIDGLIDGGMKNVVICPGSRSTPLAISCARRAGDIRAWILYDERSAGFFALGVARASDSPVAVICTSGTAAANLLPAVAEANLGRSPIIVVTADRPPELREFGGAQTIDQVQLFGSHVKWSQDMPVSTGPPSLTRFARAVGARAAATALSPKRGPVHINFPFREPLLLDSSFKVERADPAERINVVGSANIVDEADLEPIAADLGRFTRGLIIAGQGDYPEQLQKDLQSLSERLGWPILADALSNLRQRRDNLPNVIAAYEGVVRAEETRMERPEVVLRLGAVPTSKELNSYCVGARVILLDDANGWRDPDFGASTVIHGDPGHLVSRLNGLLGEGISNPDWLQRWLKAATAAESQSQVLMRRIEEPFEGKLFYELARQLDPASPLTVVVGSSMPIRDLDYFFHRGSRNIRFFSNRGANGIDGVVSTAMGYSAVEGDVLLVLGDVSFYHDMNGLLAAKLYGLNATVIVINNRGSGIFSFLQQHSLPKDLFERLFGESHDLDFSGVRLIYGGSFTRVSDWAAFEEALAFARKTKGLKVIELFAPDRERNLELHREVFKELAAPRARMS